MVNKLGRERYSIPFFFEPNFDTEVGAALLFLVAVFRVRRAKAACLQQEGSLLRRSPFPGQHASPSEIRRLGERL